MSIEAMKLAIEAIQDLRGYRPDIDKAIDAIRAAIQQAEAQQPATPEPVAAEFFAYHADMGVVFFKSESEAREGCAENLREERKEANSTGEWNDDLAESIRYGVVLGRAKFFPDSDNHDSGDYRMVYNAAPQAPSVPDDVVRDAERYRWLKDRNNKAQTGVGRWESDDHFTWLCDLDADEAIDAAMLAAQDRA